MHYYQHNIGDFNNATRYLTLVERALYRDLIEMYYDTEKPIDGGDFDRLARRLLCRTDEEKVALKFVLSEFFTFIDGYYTQSRCEREIAEYHGKKEQQSKAGKASAQRRAVKKTANTQNSTNENTSDADQSINEQSTDVEQALDDRSTNYKPLTNNHKPITINQEPFNNLKNINNWLNFEKLEKDFMSAYPDLDFELIKTASWFNRELQAFESYNAERELGVDQMHYYFADRLATVFKGKYSKTKDEKSSAKKLTEKQISFFASKLANHHEFASAYAPTGWSSEKFTGWVNDKLSEQKYLDEWMPYLKKVGFGDVKA